MKTYVRMFQPQFCDDVEIGKKRKTVRAKPKRMPKTGDKISCRAWIGKPYRSKQRILRESLITEVFSIDIFGDSIHLENVRISAMQREEFAKSDGFTSFTAMVDFFRKTHGLPFEGIVIVWN